MEQYVQITGSTPDMMRGADETSGYAAYPEQTGS